MTPDQQAVAEVNAAFYEAFETADVERMHAVWDDVDPDALVCVHPGWPALRGRTQVLRSWSAVMATTDYVQVVLSDVQVDVHGDTAVVSCTENVLTSVAEMHGGAIVATNVLRRRPGGWRLVVHHGSPVMGELSGE